MKPRIPKRALPLDYLATSLGGPFFPRIPMCPTVFSIISNGAEAPRVTIR